nr:MAG: hypothetical protein DIU57_17505 [Pseudomonadota bacterium]
MSDRKIEASLQIVLVSSDADAEAIRQAGFRSVRVVARPEDLYRPTVDGYEIDTTLQLFTRYILAFPADQAALRDAVAVRLGDTQCRWVNWPDGTGSARRAIQEFGSDGLGRLVREARPMWTDEVCTIDDIPEPGPEKTYTSGFPLLDKHGFRFVRPAFMSVIGPYGSGKSVLLRQLAANLWRLHGWRTLITSFEERVKPRMQRDFRRYLIGAPECAWKEGDVEKVDKEISAAFRFLRRPRNDRLDLERLLDRISFAVRVYGVDVVIVDPVNEIDHSVPKHQSKTDYMGDFIMALKALADDYDLLMICAAHPPKDGVEKRLAKGRLLTLNDAADTAHYGNKSDIGWCVWRPGFDGPTLLHIDKLKDHETMGRPTLAKLELMEQTNSFRVTKIGYDVIGEFVE